LDLHGHSKQTSIFFYGNRLWSKVNKDGKNYNS
jgi:hypothetical protein